MAMHFSKSIRIVKLLLNLRIIDAILVLDTDDPPCVIVVGALFFVLASDVSTS
jgi:hypothetical protein